MKSLLPFLLLSCVIHSIVILICWSLVNESWIPQPIRFSSIRVTLRGPINGKDLLSDHIKTNGYNSGDAQEEKGRTPQPHSLKKAGHPLGKTPPDSTRRPPTHVPLMENATTNPLKKPLPEEHYQPVALHKTPRPALLPSMVMPFGGQTGYNYATGGIGIGIGESGVRIGSDSGGMGSEGIVDPSRLSTFMEKVRDRIERNKRYPLWARRNNIEGIVIVRFTLTRKGHIQKIDLEQASGCTILDEAAKEAVLRGAPYPDFPDWLPHNCLVFKQPIHFSLKNLP